MARGKSLVSAGDFVKICEESNSVKEVMEKTGMLYNAVIGRINNYRKKGVPIKEYRSANGGAKVDVSGLTALINQLRTAHEEAQKEANPTDEVLTEMVTE